MNKNNFKLFLGINPKRPQTDRVISDYISRLRRIPKFLEIDIKIFFQITDPKVLNKKFNSLLINKEFQSKSKKVQSDIWWFLLDIAYLFSFYKKIIYDTILVANSLKL